MCPFFETELCRHYVNSHSVYVCMAPKTQIGIEKLTVREYEINKFGSHHLLKTSL